MRATASKVLKETQEPKRITTVNFFERLVQIIRFAPNVVTKYVRVDDIIRFIVQKILNILKGSSFILRRVINMTCRYISLIFSKNHQ